MMEKTETITTTSLPKWVLALFPLVLLIALVAIFLAVNPLAVFTEAFPPLEELTIQQVRFPAAGQIFGQGVYGLFRPLEHLVRRHGTPIVINL